MSAIKPYGKGRVMKQSKRKMIGVCAMAVGAVFLTPAYSSTDSVLATTEAYFSFLKDGFNQCAASSIVKNARSPQLRAYFSGIMKKYPTIQTLMRVDAKGIVVCECIKGEKHAVKKRSVAKRSWFLKTAKGFKEYNCMVKEKNGRSLLYWSIPMLRDGAGPGRFNGAVVAAIDLKGCFRAIAMAGAQPFLVRLNNINVYEHAWKNKMIFVETRINVPGVEGITIRYQKSNVSIMSQTETPHQSNPETLALTSAASSARSASDSSKAEHKVSAVSAAKKNMPIIVSLIVLIIIVMVLLIIQIVDRINQRRTTQSLDKFDRL
jgi:hypothetical protein